MTAAVCFSHQPPHPANSLPSLCNRPELVSTASFGSFQPQNHNPHLLLPQRPDLISFCHIFIPTTLSHRFAAFLPCSSTTSPAAHLPLLVSSPVRRIHEMLSLKTFVLTMLATFVAGQGVTSALAPEASAPASCVGSYDGTFEISVAKVEGAKKRDTNVLAVSPTPERRALPCARPLLFFLSLSCFRFVLPQARGTRHSTCRVDAAQAHLGSSKHRSSSL